MEFFNRCIEYENGESEDINPFYKARLDLVNIFFDEIEKTRDITPLVKIYSKVKTTEELEILNIYFRQYVRYSTTPWRFDVENILEDRASDCEYKKIISFCKRINISDIYGYISTWNFEITEREKLLRLLI